MIKIGLLIASFVFLFVLAFRGATSTMFNGTLTLCPSSCICSLFNTLLYADCSWHRQKNVDREQLSKQLDSLLSSNQTYGHLTQLTITNSPLTHVPRSVCRLTTLTQLHLHYNRFTRLPDNCLTNLTSLTWLSASRNYITELQDGLFDGLHTLKTLDLRHNDISSIESRAFNGLSNLKILDLSYNGITELENGLFDGLHKLEILSLNHNNISSIGSRVFGRSAELSSFRYVGLSSSNIQTVDSWPIYMAINRNVTVDFSYNPIRRLTNNMRWKDNCGMRKMAVSLSLDDRTIRNVADLLSGWNISLSTTRCTQWTFSRISVSICVYLECDCVDLVRFNLQWIQVDNTQYDLSRPRRLILNPNNTVPLDQFVCELTERCPSGCRCVHRPANDTLHIYCSNTNLTVLPLELPTPKSYPKYILDFSNNRLLRLLEHRDYFVNTSILDVSNSGIEQVESKDVWKDILKIPQLNLYGNKLTSLPEYIVSR